VIYTRRLAALTLDVAGWAGLYLAPSTGTVVIRDIVATNDSATLVDRVLLQVNPKVRTGSFLLARLQVAAGSSAHVELRQVLEPDETLLVYTSIAPISIAITGYVFE